MEQTPVLSSGGPGSNTNLVALAHELLQVVWWRLFQLKAPAAGIPERSGSGFHCVVKMPKPPLPGAAFALA